MSVTTTTSTTTSGSTTTVGATVRDPSGPSGGRKVDVYLLIEPAKVSYDESNPASPTPKQHEKTRLVACWVDQKITTTSEFNLKYTVVRKPGDDSEGTVEGTIIVYDRVNNSLAVERFSLCPTSRIPKLPSILDKGKFKSKSRRGKSRAR